MVEVQNPKYRGNLIPPVFPFIAFLFFIALLSCGSSFLPREKARDTDREFRRAMKAQSKIANYVEAEFETQPVSTSNPENDAADDPAIWVNPKVAERSVIFGSNKTGGIHAYDFSGHQLQY